MQFPSPLFDIPLFLRATPKRFLVPCCLLEGKSLSQPAYLHLCKTPVHKGLAQSSGLLKVLFSKRSNKFTRAALGNTAQCGDRPQQPISGTKFPPNCVARGCSDPSLQERQGPSAKSGPDQSFFKVWMEFASGDCTSSLCLPYTVPKGWGLH